MPFSLISGRANYFASHSPASSRSQRKLYFPPGGHTHDRQSIPTDRLLISLSDPVLVAAEQRLSNAPNKHPWREPRKRSIIEDAGREPFELGRVVLHLNNRTHSQRSASCNDDRLVTKAVTPLTMITDTQGTSLGRCYKAGLEGTVAHDPNLPDTSNDSCDTFEVMTIVGATDGSLSSANRAPPENSRYGPSLAPLASEIFKEELYIRGYLKRPARLSNLSRKPTTKLVFVGSKVFTRILGRRQGCKLAECLKTEQDVAETLGRPDAHLSEKQRPTPIASITLRVPHADGLESPGTDTNTSASESFDLHEFSYITAFTTPPSSPSIALGAETFKKGANLGDSEHAA